MTSSNYRPDIDGLRVVAVLAVALDHLSAPLMPGGYVDVDVFFVISGYLISREMEEGTFSFALFLRAACAAHFSGFVRDVGLVEALGPSVGYFK